MRHKKPSYLYAVSKSLPGSLGVPAFFSILCHVWRISYLVARAVALLRWYTRVLFFCYDSSTYGVCRSDFRPASVLPNRRERVLAPQFASERPGSGVHGKCSGGDSTENMFDLVVELQPFSAWL